MKQKTRNRETKSWERKKREKQCRKRWKVNVVETTIPGARAHSIYVVFFYIHIHSWNISPFSVCAHHRTCSWMHSPVPSNSPSAQPREFMGCIKYWNRAYGLLAYTLILSIPLSPTFLLSNNSTKIENESTIPNVRLKHIAYDISESDHSSGELTAKFNSDQHIVHIRMCLHTNVYISLNV